MAQGKGGKEGEGEGGKKGKGERRGEREEGKGEGEGGGAGGGEREGREAQQQGPVAQDGKCSQSLPNVTLHYI